MPNKHLSVSAGLSLDSTALVFSHLFSFMIFTHFYRAMLC